MFVYIDLDNIEKKGIYAVNLSMKSISTFISFIPSIN